nr:hypothetical protein [Tanacetum cinerariifolium]
MFCQIIQKNQEEKKIEEELAAKAQNSKIPVCYDDDDDYNSAITSNEPIDYLSMGDEHLNIISVTKSDKFIKSCVENLVPNLSGSEGESDYDQSFSDEDVPKKIYLNPLFDEEIILMKIDPQPFNAESDLIESMLNHDSSIIISSKIDSLFDEFTGELTLLKSIPPGINETDCHPEEETHFTKRLLFDNSSPRLPEEFVSENSNADIESFSPSPIPVEDSDSFMEDIPILEELLDNYSLLLSENESYRFDIPSSSHPLAKAPDGNTGTLNIKMMGDISEQKLSSIPGNVKTLAKGFCTQVFISSASFWKS